jgi:hypothetical protein
MVHMSTQDRTVRSSSRINGQFKGRSIPSSDKVSQVGVQEPSQPIHLVGPGRRVGPVGPTGTLKELPVLSKKLFQVIVICCGL